MRQHVNCGVKAAQRIVDLSMPNYYKVMLGKGSQYVQHGVQDGFIGVDYEIPQDLSKHLPDDWREFNKQFVPVYLASHPEKTKIAAGLACGALWTVCKGIQEGDVVLTPSGEPGLYRVGDVTGGYSYAPGKVLPHRRGVEWRPDLLKREDMSQELKNSSGGVGTVINLSNYGDELEALIAGQQPPVIKIDDELVENLNEFKLEKHLEDFLVHNWSATDLGQKFDIYTDEDGQLVGQQFKTDTGPLDILAISKDKKELLVVELKKGRVSDVVVGQILRYMGYVQDELASADQTVKGVIIAQDEDVRIRRALKMTPNIGFYTYQVSFKLNLVVAAQS